MTKEKETASTLFYTLKYSNREAWANCVDPDQMLQNSAFDQGLHGLPLIQQFLDTLTGCKMDLFKR